MTDSQIFASTQNQYRISLYGLRGNEKWNIIFSLNFHKLNSVLRTCYTLVTYASYGVILLYGHIEKKKTSTSCSGPISAQKSWCNSVLVVLFSNTMPKKDFHYSHRFSWEKKHTKLIYHMPWLYQYPPLPFHRSYKN